MRVSALWLLLLLVSCGDLFGNGSKDAGTDSINPCSPPPNNWDADHASQMFIDEDYLAGYCRTAGKRVLFFTAPGMYAPHSQWRLKVAFDRGPNAEDLDFHFGVINSVHNDTVGAVVAGSCTQPAGQNEDCVVELPTAAMDHNALWVLGYAPGDGGLTEAEGFKLHISKYRDAPFDAGM